MKRSRVYAAGAAAALAVLFVAARSRASGARIWPVRPNRGLLSAFRAPRTTSGNRYHAGVDLAALNGDEVIALDDGEVLWPVSGYSIRAGLGAVAIAHPDADYIYAEIDVLVKPGQRVSAGDVIGRVRRNADGNQMLHLEAWQSGRAPKSFTPWYVGSAEPPGLLNVQERIAPPASTGSKP